MPTDACLCRKCECSLIRKFDKQSPMHQTKRLKTECVLQLFDMCNDYGANVSNITLTDVVKCYNLHYEPNQDVILCDEHRTTVRNFVCRIH